MLQVAEQKWIDFYESYNPDKGYNLSRVAYSNIGNQWSDERRQKVMEKLAISHTTPEFREACRKRALGRIPTEESLKKRSDTMKKGTYNSCRVTIQNDEGIREFVSISEAARYFNVSQEALRRPLSVNGECQYRGYKVSIVR